jgi:putative ABC transport system permease protein
MGTLWQDVRYGLRRLARNPGFTAVAVLTLALGIGAATAIYNLAQALLVRSVPGVREPERLVQIGHTRKGEGFGTLSYADFAEFRAQAKTLELAAVYDTPFHLGARSAAERLRGAVVSANYFDLLGVGVAAGRTFVAEDDLPGRGPVAVISFELWQRAFGGGANIVGRTVMLNGYPFTIVGVTTAPFRGTERRRELEVWVPMASLAQAAPSVGTRTDIFSDHGAVWHDAIGRLKLGISLRQARTELETITRRLEQAFPNSNDERGVAVEAGMSVHQRDRAQTRQIITLLLAVAGLVLVGACANVANMQLALGAVRRHEMGVRLALGAGGGRLVRQLLTESVLLALMAGGLGLLPVVWLSRLFVRLAPAAMGLSSLQLGPDGRVFAFAAGLALFTAVACGLAPAWRQVRGDLVDTLKDASAHSGSSRSGWRNGLVVAQVAFSLLLLVGAGLFLRTLQSALDLRAAFAVRSVLVATVDLGLQDYDSQRGLQFFTALRDRVLQLPGVQAAGFAAARPFHDRNEETPARAQGAEQGGEAAVCCTTVTPGFLQTLAIPLLRGRDFAAGDASGAPLVAIVDESTARRLWPGRSVLGERVVLGGRFGGQSFEVVGLARDTQFGSVSQPVERMIYLAQAQHYQPQMVLHVRTAGDPTSLTAGVRAALASLEPDLPLFAIRTLADEFGQSLGAQRVAASLISVAAALALTLASVGLYGVVAWSVARRTREIGLRMALGARPRDVRRMVLTQAGRLILGGLAIGLGLSFGLTRLVRSQLVGITPTDPAAFAVGSLILISVALVACYLPARRAARIDPMVALRCE